MRTPRRASSATFLLTLLALLIAVLAPAVAAPGGNGRGHEMGNGRGDGLPPGLEKRDEPPPGLADGLPPGLAVSDIETVEIQIISYSDWHGQLDPLSVFGAGDFGGAAALSSYFAADAAEYENTLIVTGGDDFGASPPLSSFFLEEPAVLAQNLMGLHFSALGNHNFDKGIDHLQSMIDIAEYQYLGANLENVDANLDGVEPYAIFDFGEIQVAVVGVTNQDAPTLVFPGSFGTIVVGDPVAAANAARDAAEAEGADVFVLVAHEGVTSFGAGGNPEGEIIDIAEGVEGFDLILGDHTDVQFAGEVNGTLVVENRSKGRTYARTVLTVETYTGEPTSVETEFVEPVSDGVTPDQDILDLLQPFRDLLGPIFSTVVGSSSVEIPRADSCGQGAGRTCESLVGNVVTDALRATYGTDFAITNSGGLRANLTCPSIDNPTDFCDAFTPPPYPITRGQVQTVLPFGNVVVTLDVSGAVLKEFLENGVSSMPAINGRYAQVSGLCFTYDIDAAAGSRVTSAVRQAADGSCTGAAIDLTSASTYSLATNDFMASGGDGYPVVIGSATTRDFMDQVVADHLTAVVTVSPSIEGRITCSGTTCPVPLP